MTSPPPISTLFPYTTLFRSVHDSRARLHHAMPMPQELPQIAVLPTRYPDLRKAIFQQQTQNQLCVLSIRLLLAQDRKSTRLNSSHLGISYAVFCLKKKKLKY